jgi:hypothetical protein
VADDREQPLVRGAGYVLLSIAAVTAAMTLRLMSDGSERLSEASRAMEKGDRAAAVAALEDAAKAYVPGGRHVPRALRELCVMARAAEMRGEDKAALKIWEVVRRAVLATRHFFQPNKETLIEAEKAVVRIRQKEQLRVSPETLVKRPDDPSALLSLLLFFGFSAWMTGACLLILRPSRKDGTAWISLPVSAVICFGGVALWLSAAWLV